jgi:hypothetical protein
VRRLVVFVLVIGAGLGWVVRQAHIQGDAVAAIRRTGGAVKYDWEWRDWKDVPGGNAWAPRWIVDLIGVDYFGHVTRVELVSVPSVTNATLAHVGRLTRLQELNVVSPSVSDAGLEHLKALTELSDLSLNGLVRLRSLTLERTEITDAGLAPLKGLTSLSVLRIGKTQVTDAGIKELQQALPSLTIYR